MLRTHGITLIFGVTEERGKNRLFGAVLKTHFYHETLSSLNIPCLHPPFP